MINGKFYCPGKNQQCVIHCSTDTDCPSEKPICGKYLKNSENKICSVDISKIKDNTQGGLKSKQSGGSIRIDDTKGYYLGGTNEHKVSNISLSYKYTNFDIIYEEEIIDNKTENQIKQYCLNKLYDDYENKYDIIQYINQTTNKFIIKLYRLPFNMCIISRNIEETHITPTPSPTITLTMNGGTTEDSTLSKFYKTLIRESIITDKNIKILDYETNNIINNLNKCSIEMKSIVSTKYNNKYNNFVDINNNNCNDYETKNLCKNGDILESNNMSIDLLKKNEQYQKENLLNNSIKNNAIKNYSYSRLDKYNYGINDNLKETEVIGLYHAKSKRFLKTEETIYTDSNDSYPKYIKISSSDVVDIPNIKSFGNDLSQYFMLLSPKYLNETNNNKQTNTFIYSLKNKKLLKSYNLKTKPIPTEYFDSINLYKNHSNNNNIIELYPNGLNELENDILHYKKEIDIDSLESIMNPSIISNNILVIIYIIINI